MPIALCDCLIGLHLLSAHLGGGYEPATVGAYLRRADGLTVGALRNSEGRVSAYAAHTWETADRRFALSVGAITGYRTAPVSPMVVPSVRMGLGDQAALRLAYVPKPHTPRGSAAMHLTVEAPW